SGASWRSGGKFGNAVSFNSTSSYVEAVDIDALTPGTGATFEAWVYLNSAPTEIASVFNKWSQTVDDEYLFGINPNQTLFFTWHTTGGDTWPSVSFNSTSSYVEAVDIDALTPGTGATFEAWVYLNSAPTEIASVFNKWSQTVDDEYLFGINPNQTLFFTWHTTGGDTWPSVSFN